MSNQNVREYRSKVILNINDKPVVATITGSDEQDIKTLSSVLFMNQPTLSTQAKSHALRFEKTQNGTTQLFHESRDNGKKVVGWITDYDIPYEMSTEGIIDQQQKLHKVA